MLKKCLLRFHQCILETILGNIESILQLGNGDHLDGMVLGEGIANPDTNLASFAAIDRHIGGASDRVIKNGVGLRTKLSAKPAFCRATNFNIDICY